MRKLKGKFTTILNDYITDGKIDACEFRILCYLCKLANEENSCYPSQSTIAKNTHISLTKVKKSVKRLVELELITTTNRLKNNGSNDTNIYVVCEKTDTDVATNTGDSVSNDLPGSVREDPGGLQDGYNKYINNNTNNSINTYHLSIEDVLEQAETENLSGLTRKDFESAIEIMYNSKSISVGGRTISQAEVHKRLENISYEHIVYVDNNMPRNIDANHNIEINVRNPVPYIVTDKTLMIKFKKSFDGTITDELSNAGVAKLEHMMDLEDAVWYTAYIKDGDEVETVLENVRELSNVIVAELNFTAEASSTGIVENVDISHHHGNHRVHEQWHLKAGGLVRGWNHMKEHNVPEGGSSNVVVAVIDTGVDYTHEDLKNNIWVNTAEIPDNNIDDDGNGYVDDYYGVNINTKKGNGNDDNGHGTHVAGIIAAADNNTGVLGVAYNAKIMPIKAGMSSGYFLQSDIANSILYAYNHGADVINMSFGGSASSIAVQDALAVAYSRCILVAAAGNDGKPNEYVPGWETMPTYPAALKYVLGVMSVDDQGVEASYSNWDVEAFNSVEYELYAPGSAILSTLPGDRYASWNGTSMAAPYVSGMLDVVGGSKCVIDNDAEKEFLKSNIGENYNNLLKYIIELPCSDIDYINLNSYDVTIDTENPFQIETTVEPTSAKAEDLVYTTDESGIVEVSETGLITGLQVGSAKVYVSSPDRYVIATIDVTVKETTPLEIITLSNDELYLDVGDTWYTAPVLTPADTSMTRLTFASSDEAVATVDNMGVITAIDVGDAQITATGINGVRATLNLRVGISPESISFDSKYYMAGLDTTEFPEVVFLPENTTETELTWEIADTSIAEIIDGQLVCNGIGTTILRATTYNGKSADIYISVNEEVANSPAVEYMYTTSGAYYFLRCEDGSIWHWSVNSGIPKKITVDGEVLTGVRDMATNAYYYNSKMTFYALNGDGKVEAYEVNDNGIANFSSYLNISDVKEISRTQGDDDNINDAILFLKNDGTLWQQYKFESSEIVQLDTSSVGEIVDIASNHYMIFVLNSKGELWKGNVKTPFELVRDNVVSLQDMNGNHYNLAIYTDDDIICYRDSAKPSHSLGLKGDKMFATPNLSYYVEGGAVFRVNIVNNITKLDGINNAENVFFKGDDDTASAQYIATSDGRVYAVGKNNNNSMTSMAPSFVEAPNSFELPLGFHLKYENPMAEVKNINEENMLYDDAIQIGFTDNVTQGDNFVRIALKADGETVSSYKHFDMNKLYIKPVAGFESGVEYTLSIPEGAVKSISNYNSNAIDITFTVADGELSKVYPEKVSYEKPQSPALPETPADNVVIDETVERFEWTAETIIAKCEEARPTGIFSDFTGNAILNRLYDDNVELWLRPTASEYSSYTEIDLGGNWWGTTDKFLIGKQILDYDDYQTMGDILEDNILTAAPENVWPFVTEAYLENAEGERVETIGNEAVTFVLKFNRDMNTEVPFTLAFGSTYPFADYEVEGDYVDSRTWKGSTTLTTLIENGTQYLNIKGAIGDDGREIPWDRGRFVFNIDTTSALAMTLQGEADDNGIKLTWYQDDFDTLAGYNVYRSESEDGFYQKLNSTILTEKEFYDDTVEPGKVYYYNFTVVKTDLSESTPSGKTVIRAKDTMSPTMYHTPIYTAYTGSNLIVNATVTDNVAVNNVTLYYRTVGETEWKSLAMTNLNDKYSAVINANNITTDGLEYYIDAYDGVTHAYRGTEAEPYVVTVKLAVSNNAKGDVDGNGKINLLDALLILQAKNDRYNMTEEEFLRADLDDNKVLDSWEALRVMQYSNGKISSVLPDTEEE